MTLLVLDTATDRCALALSFSSLSEDLDSDALNNQVIENTRSIPRAHNEHMLQMLDELFTAAELSPRELTAIGFAAGPGSFTGIRISAAAAQALAVAAGAQVVPISSSRLLAAAALRELGEDAARRMPARLQTVLRSRRNYVYVATYQVVSAATQEVADRLVLESDDVLFEDAELIARSVPDDCVRVMEGQEGDEGSVAFAATAVSVAIRDLLELVRADLAQGRGLPPEGAQPRYVEGDTPWQPRPANA